MRILALTYQDDAGPGVFADPIEARGAQLDVWRVAAEPHPPADPLAYDAVMTFGGSMHADQDDLHPWLIAQRQLLRELLEHGTPLLGACLGAQLLCQAAGGEARRLVEPEIGWVEVEVLENGGADPLLGPLAPGFSALEWHSYECVTPPESLTLARSASCVQAFRVGRRAWGIQFHAEVSRADLDHWLDQWDEDPDAVRIGLDAEALRAKVNEALEPWQALGRDLCDRFLDAAAAVRS